MLDGLEDALHQARRQALNLQGAATRETVDATALQFFEEWRGMQR